MDIDCAIPHGDPGAVEPMGTASGQENVTLMARKAKAKKPAAVTQPPRCRVRDHTGQCARRQAVLDKGLCTAHYKRLQRTGKVGPAKLGAWHRIPAPVEIGGDPNHCKVRGCQEPVVYRRQRLCRPHYRAHHRKKEQVA